MGNKSKIKNGSNNVVLQNCEINNAVNNYVNTSFGSVYSSLASHKNYKAIQDLLKEEMDEITKVHPLFPLFSAKWDSRLYRLVSNAETEEALNKYPKTIKEELQVDYSKYPGIDKNETIWDYAYRTQTKIEFRVLDHKEFLGDIEDPFPSIVCGNNTMLVMEPPAFPPPMKVHLLSGDSDIEIMLRRKPSIEYDVLMFGNTSSGHSFDIEISLNQKTNRMDFTIKENSDFSIENVVLREKFLANIAATKKLKLAYDNDVIIDWSIDDDSINNPLLRFANTRYNFYNSLFEIGRICNCDFEIKNISIREEDVELALLILHSLRDEWFSTKTESERFRCDYNSIHLDDKTATEKLTNKIAFEGILDGDLVLFGRRFRATKAVFVCHDAKINNIKSVRKRINKKESEILITIKSINKNQEFVKSTRFENLVFIG